MYCGAALFSQTEDVVKLPFSELGFGAVTFAIFVALAVVVWTYRDVANRHAPNAADPNAAEHVGAPGASSHGDGEGLGHHQGEHR